MTFLEALHTSRQRQAAREIERYRHLIDEANASAVRHEIARAHVKPSAASPDRAAPRPAWPLLTLPDRIRMWARAA